ncbi:putative multidrug resistance protein [Platanthera zijinensis]|uniref:Multidrug resistance protein n=1 Tax=Platanthera zijinensis TaxID=2320716 RepID=A0AAP0BEN5_9ASPA
MRARYLSAILQQEVAYFDLKGASMAEVVNTITNDSSVIQDFLSEKVPNFISNFTAFIAGYAVAFSLLKWFAVVIIFPTAFLLIIPGLFYGRVLLKLSSKLLTEYNKAAVVVEQAVSSIRTVYAFRAERRTANSFSTNLKSSVRIGLQHGLVKSLALGSAGISFSIWAFLVWYNSLMVMYHGVKGGSAYVVGISVVSSGLYFGSCISNLKYFGDAVSAAKRINEVIVERRGDRMKCLKSREGDELPSVKGEVEFREVRFAYPASPDAEVIRGFNLKICEGKTVALVGHSGSGKSTVIALLQRLYEPTSGEILLDGVAIQTLRLKWFREQMGLVSQEPTLFGTSIKENIMFGKENATMDEVLAAAKSANANGFISHLPRGYDTQVGEGGVQLSGGQKQRIAIARAIIRSPKILLLDEATSALDYESERMVQEAFESAAAGRSAIVIAHRLSTIRNADTIAFVQRGRVVEFGSHEDLMRNQDEGHYSSLVSLQESQMFLSPANIHDNANAMTITACSPSSVVHNKRRSSSNLSNVFFEPLSFSNSMCSFAIEDDFQGAKAGNNNLPTPAFWKMLMLSAPEWPHVVMGCAGALLIGAVSPIYGFATGNIASTYFLKDHDELKERTRTYSLMLLALSLFCFLVNIMQHYNLAVMGEHLTNRIRERLLSKMLTFEVSWFDQDENSSGFLCSRLAKDANVVRSLVGDRLSLIVQTMSSMSIAIFMGLLIAWKFAVLIISLQPLLIICHYARFALLAKMSKKSLKAQAHCSKLVGEAIHNLNTVFAFSLQDRILQLFNLAQSGPHSTSINQAWTVGVGLGLSQFINICITIISLWYGSLLISHGYITSKQFFLTFPILMRTGHVIAEAGTLTSDLSKGASSVASVFAILNRNTIIEPDSQEGCCVESLNGDIQLLNVDYAYLTRPNVPVLRRFSLSIKAGQSAALVGPSGSGKSTIIALIERFYDPLRGEIQIDGKDIRLYNLRSLRQHIALVSQEPVLFAGTVKDNITYGVDGDISSEEIEAAARAANAHDFICSLPNGYQTSCGDRGKKLSGGQKQRIAIARAMLCNPTILLLDEATSAIDAQSERIVNEALERVMVGRTTVVVAHNLTTVRNCHLIAVLDKGVLVENGDHDSLMKKQPNGMYYKLVNLQNKVDNKKR